MSWEWGQWVYSMCLLKCICCSTPRVQSLSTQNTPGSSQPYSSVGVLQAAAQRRQQLQPTRQQGCMQGRHHGLDHLQHKHSVAFTNVCAHTTPSDLGTLSQQVKHSILCLCPCWCTTLPQPRSNSVSQKATTENPHLCFQPRTHNAHKHTYTRTPNTPAWHV